MDMSRIAQDIGQILNQELLCLEKLDELLGKEHQAIKTSEAEYLQQILQQKQPYIIQLHQLDQKRTQTLTCNGLSPDKDTMHQVIAHAHSPDLGNTWEKLKAAIRKLKLSNEVNGRLIHMRKNTNDSILKILLGTRHSSAETYGSNGRAGMYTKTGLSAVV